VCGNLNQYEFSKSISIAADNIGFVSIYAYDHLIPFYSNDLNKNIFECLSLLTSVRTITKTETNQGNLPNVNLAIVAANNHYAGFGPATANTFRQLLGLEGVKWGDECLYTVIHK
jgi:hypothetical protein